MIKNYFMKYNFAKVQFYKSTLGASEAPDADMVLADVVLNFI